MASVRERQPGRWQLRVYAGRDPLTGRKVWAAKTVAATGKRDAQDKANRWEIELADSRPRPGADSTFRQLADQWIDVKARRWSPSVLKEHRRIVDRNLRPLHDLDVTRITTHTLDVLYGALAERGGACTHRPPCSEHPCSHGGPLAISTVKRIHVVVHSALEQAVKWGWIARNPAKHADPGEVIETEINPPDVTDVLLLLATAAERDPRLATYLLVAVATGARRGAMCALRWSDLDLAAGVARFRRVVVHGPDGPVERQATRTKKSGRNVALDPYAVAALATHQRRQATVALDAGALLPPDALVFSDDILGRRPWRPDSTSRKFRHLSAGVGLNETRLHDLRHFMATSLLSAGVDPKVIAQRGGWTKVATMLDRYAHALPASDRAAAELMGGMLGGGA